VQALQSADAGNRDDFHFTSVMSISEKAAEAIRETLLKTVETIEPVIKSAKDESVHALMIDLFSLRGRAS